MSFPNSNINTAKLGRSIANGIGWFVIWFIMFPIMVMGGIMSILITKFTENKDNANTRGTSVESKIHPKNTKKVRNDFGFPTRDLL